MALVRSGRCSHCKQRKRKVRITCQRSPVASPLLTMWWFDEQRPACTACVIRNVPCTYPSELTNFINYSVATHDPVTVAPQELVADRPALVLRAKSSKPAQSGTGSIRPSGSERTSKSDTRSASPNHLLGSPRSCECPPKLPQIV